jgi:hypothetical protein
LVVAAADLGGTAVAADFPTTVHYWEMMVVVADLGGIAVAVAVVAVDFPMVQRSWEQTGIDFGGIVVVAAAAAVVESPMVIHCSALPVVVLPAAAAVDTDFADAVDFDYPMMGRYWVTVVDFVATAAAVVDLVVVDYFATRYLLPVGSV